jgi:hypothetical protein
MIAYKLVRIRKDKSLGPLFIDKALIFEVGIWYTAKEVYTKGFAFRPGFHCCKEAKAPHLNKNGRVWCKVEINNFTEYIRPAHQGGIWYTAKKMKIIKILD